MLTGLNTYFTQPNKLAGIEICETPSGIKFHALLIKRVNNRLEVEGQASFDHLEDALGFAKSLPICAVLNTNQVLTKMVEANNSGGNTVSIVNKAFPNFKMEDFYFEVLKNNGGNQIVSVCRKDLIEGLIQKIHKNKALLCGVYLGLNSLINTIPFIRDTSVQTSTFLIEKKENKILGFERFITVDSREYDINGIKIGNNFLLAFSTVLQYLSKTFNDGNLIEVNQGLGKETANRYFFKQFLKFGLAFFLCLLLINFAVFNLYFSKVEALKLLGSVSEDNKKRVIRLDSIVSIKQKKVEDILSASSSKSSFYIDQVVGIMPSSMLLDEIVYQPLESRIKENKKISILQNQITIRGNTGDSEAFSSWIESLEELKWVSSVEVTNFGAKNKNFNGFTIELNLADE